MKSHLSTNYLQKVKASLPPSGMETIAEKLNVSVSTVSRVMNGKSKKRQNEVLQVALDLIEKNEMNMSDLKSRIKSL